MKGGIERATDYTITAVQAAAVAVVAAAATFVRRSPGSAAAQGRAPDEQDVRLRLGRRLALAPEFALAADILLTAVAPTWEEIGKLAAIVVLRTALNYFLQREVAGAARGGG